MKKTNIHANPITAAVAVTIMLLTVVAYYANEFDKVLNIERPSFITVFLATMLFSISAFIIASRIYRKRENWKILGTKISRFFKFYAWRITSLRKA
jgi:uncharacterized membrane-anchored protein YitT (DUF2179 family)